MSIKLEIINKKLQEFTFTPEARKKESTFDKLKDRLLETGANDPVYQFEFGDLQNFENSINKIKQDNNLNTCIVGHGVQPLGRVLPSIIFFAIIIGIWIYIMRRMSAGAEAVQGANLQHLNPARSFYEKTDVKTTFKDVASLEGDKRGSSGNCGLLKTLKSIRPLEEKIPKGSYCRSSRTGKTLLAKAVAGESQGTLFSLSGSDFVEMFVGVGASKSARSF